MKTKTFAATFIVLLFLSILLNANIAFSPPSTIEKGSLEVDIFTNKKPYNGKGFNQTSDAFSPYEKITIYTSVTYSKLPLQDILVSINIRGPPNEIENITFSTVVKTNETGLATFEFSIPWPYISPEKTIFGLWTVSAFANFKNDTAEDFLYFEVGWIVDITTLETIDNEGNPRDEFAITGDIGLRLTLKSISKTYQNISVCIGLQDVKGNLKCEYIKNLEIQPNEEPVQLFYKIGIPKYFVPGDAVVYSFIYKNDSAILPVCPRKNVSISIVYPGTPLYIEFHDISVTRITSKSTIQSGETVKVRVTVRNEATETETFNLTLYYNSTIIGVKTVENLTPYEQEVVEFSWNTSGLLGLYVLRAEASVVEDEMETSDNVRVETVNVVYLYRNLVVKSVKPLKNIVFLREVAAINVTISNEGTENENFTLKLFAGLTLIELKEFRNFTSGKTESIIFLWNTREFETGVFAISAQIPPVEGENRTDDNFLIDGVVWVINPFLSPPTFPAPPPPPPPPPPPEVHDIALLNIIPNTTEAQIGQLIEINVTVKNNGTVVESFYLEIYCNETLIDKVWVESLQNGTQREIQLLWNTTELKEGNYVLRAYVPPLVNETNVKNNEVRYEYVKLSAPPPETRTLIIVLIIIIILIASIVTYMLLRKRRTEKEYLTAVVSFSD